MQNSLSCRFSYLPRKNSHPNFAIYSPRAHRHIHEQIHARAQTHTHIHSTTFSSHIHSLRELRADVQANERVCKSLQYRVVSRAKESPTFVHTTRSKLEELTSKKVRNKRPPDAHISPMLHQLTYHTSRPSQMQNNTSPPTRACDPRSCAEFPRRYPSSSSVYIHIKQRSNDKRGLVLFCVCRRLSLPGRGR